MSRIGKLPIKVPDKVNVKINSTSITVKGEVTGHNELIENKLHYNLFQVVPSLPSLISKPFNFNASRI